MNTHTRTHARTHAPTPTHPPTHTHTHPPTHPPIHTHAHTHTIELHFFASVLHMLKNQESISDQKLAMPGQNLLKKNL